ncbi:NAD-dependent epimerase/dehydratase family protein, partial [uncultured Arthrobacter sp.]|uniref:NAD-dependent epimerase/dehydratase family protein n=1 Tax=uncultured Arthrobacter sp. TaxID=114050 RepID=UPI0025EEB9BC
MKALVVGATGYLGSHVAAGLRSEGYEVHGLARSDSSADRMRERGIVPLPGDASDIARVAESVGDFDTVVMSAMLPFRQEAELTAAIVEQLSGSSRSLIFVSGTGVLSIAARDGQWNENTFAEDDPFPHPELPNRMIRIRTENIVRDAARTGLRTVVVRPPLLWGEAGSVQVPQFFNSVLQTGQACYLGAGLNLYSHAHVRDVADVVVRASERGTPGALYHVVAGEVAFRTVAEAVAAVTGQATRSVDFDEAIRIWGERWVTIGLAVNSRSRAPRTRAELDWTPRFTDLVEDIRSGSYAQAWSD